MSSHPLGFDPEEFNKALAEAVKNFAAVNQRFQEAVREAVVEMNRRMRLRQQAKSSIVVEALSREKYKREIAYQRMLGLRHVHDEARRVRRELGMIP